MKVIQRRWCDEKLMKKRED